MFSCSISGCRRKNGLRVITELMSHGEPKPRIIVMTTYESEGDVRRALKAGAKGYLVKGQIPGKSGKLSEKLPQDKLCFNLKSLPSSPNPCRPVLSFPSASFRFCSIWLSKKRIKRSGQVLYISENTVKGHVKSILTKLDAIGRTEAIAIANRRGIIQTSYLFVRLFWGPYSFDRVQKRPFGA